MPSGIESIDEMLATLPKEERVLVNRLRAIIAECLPKAEERAYYGEGVPFYRHNKLICYIWPASVFWGPKRPDQTQKAKGTALGFNQGYLMSNEDGALLAEGRKQVYVMYFHSIKDINEEQVRALLYEAGMIDDMFAKKKKKTAPPAKKKRW